MLKFMEKILTKYATHSVMCENEQLKVILECQQRSAEFTNKYEKSLYESALTHDSIYDIQGKQLEQSLASEKELYLKNLDLTKKVFDLQHQLTEQCAGGPDMLQRWSAANEKIAKMETHNDEIIEAKVSEQVASELSRILSSSSNELIGKVKEIMKMDLEQLKEKNKYCIYPFVPGYDDADDPDNYDTDSDAEPEIDAALRNDDDADKKKGELIAKGECKWMLYHNMCSLGGCEFNGELFDTELEAYRMGTILGLVTHGPDTSCACPSCYAEYMQDCI